MPVRCSLSLVVALACASCAGRDAPRPAALDWRPNLDQPIRQLEEVLSATEQQQPRNYTIANLAFVLDAKLYVAFRRHLDALAPHARPAALEEQRRWLAERRRRTDAACAEYEGGTFASFAGSRAYVDATRARIADIERRAAMPGESAASAAH